LEFPGSERVRPGTGSITRLLQSYGGQSEDDEDEKDRQLQEWVGFSIWLGLLGLEFARLFEFGLYIPGLAWTALVFMGWLLARVPAQFQTAESGEQEIQSTKARRKA